MRIGPTARTLAAFLIFLASTALLSATITLREANASPSGLKQHAPIIIDGSNAFTAGNGVIGGNGTANNPFVIQGWSIDASSANGIEIRNIVNGECVIINGTCVPPPTYFVIRNVFIHSETRRYADIVLNSDLSPPGLSCYECPGNIFPGVIANSTLTDNAYGIILSDSNNMQVIGVTVKGTDSGIQCINSSFSQIIANRIADSHVGINLSCSLVDPLENTIYDTDYGIIVAGASIDAERNNIITPRGFTLTGANSVIVANNKVSNGAGLTTKTFQYGISATGSQGFSIINNTINNGLQMNLKPGSAGISIAYSGDFAIFGNTIGTSKAFGVVLRATFASQSSSDPFLNHNFVYHNNFLNNKVQAFDDSPSQNLWDDGYPTGGNFWSDFNGSDNCSGPSQNICPSPDGIGDTPYVFNYNEDHYPLMKLFA